MLSHFGAILQSVTEPWKKMFLTFKCLFLLMTQHHLVSALMNESRCVPAVLEVPQRAILLPSVIVKEGYLHKHKAEGTQLLSRFAFKKRYFWLTSETLSYAKTSEWQVSKCQLTKALHSHFGVK